MGSWELLMIDGLIGMGIGWWWWLIGFRWLM